MESTAASPNATGFTRLDFAVAALIVGALVATVCIAAILLTPRERFLKAENGLYVSARLTYANWYMPTNEHQVASLALVKHSTARSRYSNKVPHQMRIVSNATAAKRLDHYVLGVEIVNAHMIRMYERSGNGELLRTYVSTAKQWVVPPIWIQQRNGSWKRYI